MTESKPHGKAGLSDLLNYAVQKGYFRITIPERPFSGEPIKFTDKNFPPGQGYRELLTNNELLYLSAAVKDLSLARLDAVLRRVYHYTGDELKDLTWDKIGVCCQDCLESQNTTPAKPAQKIKEPTEEAKIAYQLYYSQENGKQAEVARMMSMHFGRKIGQYSVSRWAASYKSWLGQQGLPVAKLGTRELIRGGKGRDTPYGRR